MKNIIDKIKKQFKNPKFKKSFFIFFAVWIFIVSMFAVNTLQQEIKYNNKKVILKEITKITPYDSFEKLCSNGDIKVVYYNKNKDTLLYTVKFGVTVKQIDYQHNSIKDIYNKEQKNEKYRKNPGKYKDKVILAYKSFNPKTEDFRKFLLENHIQVIDVNEKKIDIFRIFSTLIYIVFIYMIYKTMNIGQSDENEEVTQIPNVTFEDIEGNQEAKEELRIIVDFLEHPKKYEKMGAKIPKGVILYGPPGTGKTLLAKAIAGEAKVPFFSKGAADFVEVYVGVGAKRVKSLFNKARKKAPCIIFIDEIDAIGGQRGISKNDEKDQTLNKLLVELDGFKSSERIIVIAATNRVDMLDKALTRSGRFDKHISIELPNKKDRIGILNVHFKNKLLDSTVNLNEIAQITSGFSGADIATLANESAIISCVKNHESITKEDIDEAYIKTAMKSTPKRDLTRSQKEIKTIAYHEAGHALIAKLIGNDVHKVTIIGTTSGVGGFTSTTGEEIGLLSKEDFENEIKILLGGRAAEYLLFDKNEEKITVGASNDIQRATTIINAMIKEYGMLIKSSFKNEEGLSKEMYSPFRFKNDKNDENLDLTGSTEATKLYNESIKMLDVNKNLLDKIAEKLIEKETLSGEEISEIFSLKVNNNSND